MTKTNLTVAEYLTKAIELSGRTQREIAREVGYPIELDNCRCGVTARKLGF